VEPIKHRRRLIRQGQRIEHENHDAEARDEKHWVMNIKPEWPHLRLHIVLPDLVVGLDHIRLPVGRGYALVGCLVGHLVPFFCFSAARHILSEDTTTALGRCVAAYWCHARSKSTWLFARAGHLRPVLNRRF
jgi:hypothetical protein